MTAVTDQMRLSATPGGSLSDIDAMASVGATELALEFPAERASAQCPPAPRATAARHFRAERLQTLAVATTALVVGVSYGESLRTSIELVAMLALSWLVAVSLVERAVQTIRPVAGQAGIAVCGAALGAAIASLLSYFLQVGASGQAAVLSMTPLVGAIIVVADAIKTRTTRLRSRVLVVGGGDSVRQLVDLLTRRGRDRFVVTGRVAQEDDQIFGTKLLGTIGALGKIVVEQRPDLVVVAAERGRPEIFSQLANVADRKFRIVGLPEFYEHAFGRVPVRNLTDAWFMSVLHLYQHSYSRSAKRLFDLVVAATGLLVISPILPLIALSIRAGGGPVFYRQTRLGENGRPFSIVKFRTMIVDAESGGPVWAEDADPRVTAVGRILRRTRLDEVPQLLNVLRGEMAIVGPRPERPEFYEMLRERVPFWSRRHLVKPGITGWAQLSAAYASDTQATEEKLAYDLWYLRHQGLLVDFLICLRTIPLLLLAAGR